MNAKRGSVRISIRFLLINRMRKLASLICGCKLAVASKSIVNNVLIAHFVKEFFTFYDAIFNFNDNACAVCIALQHNFNLSTRMAAY